MKMMQKQDLEAFKERFKEAREKATAEGRTLPARKFKRPTEEVKERFKALKAEGRTLPARKFKLPTEEMRAKVREALKTRTRKSKTEE